MKPHGELEMYIPRCWMHTAPLRRPHPGSGVCAGLQGSLRACLRPRHHGPHGVRAAPARVLVHTAYQAGRGRVHRAGRVEAPRQLTLPPARPRAEAGGARRSWLGLLVLWSRSGQSPDHPGFARLCLAARAWRRLHRRLHGQSPRLRARATGLLQRALISKPTPHEPQPGTGGPKSEVKRRPEPRFKSPGTGHPRSRRRLAAVFQAEP